MFDREVLKKYPIFEGKVSLHLSPKEGYLYIYEYRKLIKANNNTKNFFSLNINNSAQRLFSKFNGEKTLDHIIKELTESRKSYNHSVPFVLGFLNDIVKAAGFCFIKFSDRPTKKEFDVSGSMDVIFPVHATIEITDKCNLRCNYCYRESDSSKCSFIRNPLEFFNLLIKNGIRHIELSGGEPLLHNDIKNILKYTGREFNVVALLTNGILIDNEIVEIISNFREKFVIQICLDSSKEVIADEIAGKKGSFKKIVHSIKLLADNGIKIRVGMVIDNSKRIDDIENTLLLAKDLGASWFAVNPAFNLGRGRLLNGWTSVDDVIKFNNVIERLIKSYPNFFSVNSESVWNSIKKKQNCGAGHRTITIGPDKSVRPCPLFPENFGIIYNFSESIRESFIEASKITNFFYNLRFPCEEICGICDWLAYCKNCFTRGLIKARELHYNCKWYKKEGLDWLLRELK